MIPARQMIREDWIVTGGRIEESYDRLDTYFYGAIIEPITTRIVVARRLEGWGVDGNPVLGERREFPESMFAYGVDREIDRPYAEDPVRVHIRKASPLMISSLPETSPHRADGLEWGMNAG
jgi:hypothetical protein